MESNTDLSQQITTAPIPPKPTRSPSIPAKPKTQSNQPSQQPTQSPNQSTIPTQISSPIESTQSQSPTRIPPKPSLPKDTEKDFVLYSDYESSRLSIVENFDKKSLQTPITKIEWYSFPLMYKMPSGNIIKFAVKTPLLTSNYGVNVKQSNANGFETEDYSIGLNYNPMNEEDQRCLEVFEQIYKDIVNIIDKIKIKIGWPDFNIAFPHSKLIKSGLLYQRKVDNQIVEGSPSTTYCKLQRSGRFTSTFIDYNGDNIPWPVLEGKRVSMISVIEFMEVKIMTSGKGSIKNRLRSGLVISRNKIEFGMELKDDADKFKEQNPELAAQAADQLAVDILDKQTEILAFEEKQDRLQKARDLKYKSMQGNLQAQMNGNMQGQMQGNMSQMGMAQMNGNMNGMSQMGMNQMNSNMSHMNQQMGMSQMNGNMNQMSPMGNNMNQNTQQSQMNYMSSIPQGSTSSGSMIQGHNPMQNVKSSGIGGMMDGYAASIADSQMPESLYRSLN